MTLNLGLHTGFLGSDRGATFVVVYRAKNGHQYLGKLVFNRLLAVPNCTNGPAVLSLQLQ